MATIFAADTWSLPVSTTHILSSGVAGTMAANGSGSALVHGAQYRRGLGVHAAGCSAALGLAVPALSRNLLDSNVISMRRASGLPPGAFFCGQNGVMAANARKNSHFRYHTEWC